VYSPSAKARWHSTIHCPLNAKCFNARSVTSARTY
jgi:hypothetical protein